MRRKRHLIAHLIARGAIVLALAIGGLAFVLWAAFPDMRPLIRASVVNFKIEGKSMQPTFSAGDYLLVNKLNRMPKRHEIVIIKYPKL